MSLENLAKIKRRSEFINETKLNLIIYKFEYFNNNI
jgi:hypothetical protein